MYGIFMKNERNERWLVTHVECSVLTVPTAMDARKIAMHSVGVTYEDHIKTNIFKSRFSLFPFYSPFHFVNSIRRFAI